MKPVLRKYESVNQDTQITITQQQKKMCYNAGVHLFTVGLNVLLHALEVTRAVEVKDGRGIRATLGDELEGGEALDADRLNLVGSGVELGNNDILVVLVVLTELLEVRCHLLAVTAPRGVVLDEDVLGAIEGHLIVRLALENPDGVGLVLLRNVLGLEVRGDGAGDVAGDKRLESLSRVGTLKLVLLHALAHNDDASGGDVLLSHTKELKDTVIRLGDSDKEVVTLVAGSNGAGNVDLSGVLLLRVDEDEAVLLDVATKNLLSVALGEGHNKGEHVAGDTLLDRVLGDLALALNTGLLLVVAEAAENNNGVRGRDAGGGLDGSVSGDTVESVLVNLGSVEEGLGSIRVNGIEGTEHNDLSLLLEGGESGLVGNGLGSRAGLLGHPRDNVVLLAATVVLGVLTVDDPLEGREALDTVLAGELLVLGGINSDDGETTLDLHTLEVLGGLLVLRLEGLAVATPRCVELGEDVLVLSDVRVEVVVSEVHDGLAHHHGGQRGHHEGNKRELHYEKRKG